jgi:hypothetical protein
VSQSPTPEPTPSAEPSFGAPPQVGNPYAPSAAGPVSYEHPDAGALRVLVILEFIWGGLTLLASCFSFFYIGLGIVFVAGAGGSANGPAEMFGPLFIVIGSVSLLLIVGTSVLAFLSASFISNRKNRVFCIVVSAFHCLGFPFGTALGIFGLIMLLKPSVKDLFEGRWKPPTPFMGSVPPRAPQA